MSNLPHSSFGNFLLEQGLIKPNQLKAALFEKSVTKDRIGRILVRNGFLRQEQLLRVLREVNPNALHQEAVFQEIVPYSLLKQTKSMITAIVDDTVYISTMSMPALVRKAFSPYLGTKKMVFTAVNPVQLSEYLRQLSANERGDKLTWENVFHDAMRMGASDVHILPRQFSYTISLRVDGVGDILHEGPLDEYLALAARLKDLSGMDVSERRRNQDGNFSMEFAGRLIDFRVTTLPVRRGEKIVIRLLDPDMANRSLNDLGITEVERLRRIMTNTYGLFLVCGPTGSGKSTTQVTAIREFDLVEKFLYTVEDPVELEIAYGAQVNVNRHVGLDFSGAIRGFMRADPDIIIVGEIRDMETLVNAMKAAETGHFVLGTLHVGDISGIPARLRDIGVQPHELRHLLRGAMAQRLVRTYCRFCDGAGCAICRDTGFKGRQVISEIAHFRKESDVMRMLNGEVFWETLVQDGMAKVARGVTSETEVVRAIGEIDEEYAELGNSTPQFPEIGANVPSEV